jgi:hypothetical protein
MNKSLNNQTRPCSVLRFHRSSRQKSFYYCCHKEGIDALDKLFPGFSNCLFLGNNYHYDGEGPIWSLSIEHNALETVTENGEISHPKIKTKIASLHLPTEHRACVTLDEYALLVEISEDFDNITLLFYEGLGRYASNLLTMANHDLLEITVAPEET